MSDAHAHAHTVTALEPAWVEQDHRPDANGVPEPVSDPVVRDSMDAYMDESTYTCSCGQVLSGWDDVQRHFREVASDG